VGDEYLAEISGTLESPDSMPELARSVAPGETDATTRLHASIEFVQQRIRYEAIEFGRHAHVPKSTEDTLRDGYGDCKDHSLLLYHLLRQQGFDAALALVNASGPINPELPSVDQFDHMVVYCADCPGARFIDTTDKYVSYRTSGPRSIGGRHALVLDPAAPRMEQVPRAADEEFAVEVDREIRVADDGALDVTEEVVLHRHLAATVRSILMTVDSASWKDSVYREILSDRHQVSMLELDVESAEALDAPLRMRTRYRVDDAMTRSEGMAWGRLPSSWERLFLEVDPVESRKSQFEIVEPLRIETRVKIVSPADHRVRMLDASRHAGRSKFMTWAVAEDVGDGSVVLEFTAHRLRGQFTPQEYEVFFADSMDALGALERRVEMRAESSR